MLSGSAIDEIVAPAQVALPRHLPSEPIAFKH